MEGDTNPSILMTQPVLQSTSQTSFRLFLRLPWHMIQNRLKVRWILSLFSHFFENRVRSRGEREAQVSLLSHFPLGQQQQAGRWHGSLSYGLEQKFGLFPKDATTWVPSLHQAPECSSSLYPPSQWYKTQDKRLANHYFLLLKKERQVKATALLCPVPDRTYTLFRHLPPPS